MCDDMIHIADKAVWSKHFLIAWLQFTNIIVDASQTIDEFTVLSAGHINHFYESCSTEQLLIIITYCQHRQNCVTVWSKFAQ